MVSNLPEQGRPRRPGLPGGITPRGRVVADTLWHIILMSVVFAVPGFIVLGLDLLNVRRLCRRFRDEIDDLEETVRELKGRLADAEDALRDRDALSMAVRRDD